MRDSFGAHAAIDGSFMILDFQDPADPPMVYLETATDDLYLEDPKVVQRYVGIFGHTCSAAETPQRSVAYLKNLIA
nr:Scr1 family TA system antitoxin-like transcriptional regulator [Thermobifida fusca]